MLRNSRTTLRIALVAVLVAGLAGAWFATATWRIDTESLGLSSLSENGDWVESLSVLGEQAIDFLLGWTK